MTDHTDTTSNSQTVTITESAIAEVKRLMAQEKDEQLYLRLGVAAGGCSGMSYSMAFDTEKSDTDSLSEYDGVRVLIDNRAISYLQGCILDFKGGMLGGGFHFENPNARRSCGCGTSFSC